MEQQKVVKENKDYVRVGAAIVNRNTQAYQEFVEKNKKEEKVNRRLDELESKMDMILNILLSRK